MTRDEIGIIVYERAISWAIEFGSIPYGDINKTTTIEALLTPTDEPYDDDCRLDFLCNCEDVVFGYVSDEPMDDVKTIDDLINKLVKIDLDRSEEEPSNAFEKISTGLESAIAFANGDTSGAVVHQVPVDIRVTTDRVYTYNSWLPIDQFDCDRFNQDMSVVDHVVLLHGTHRRCDEPAIYVLDHAVNTIHNEVEFYTAEGQSIEPTMFMEVTPPVINKEKTDD